MLEGDVGPRSRMRSPSSPSMARVNSLRPLDLRLMRGCTGACLMAVALAFAGALLNIRIRLWATELMTLHYPTRPIPSRQRGDDGTAMPSSLPFPRVHTQQRAPA